MRSLRGRGYRNKLCAGVVLVAVSLAMAACGSSSSSSTTSTSGSTTSSTAAPSSTNALSGAPAWLLMVVHPLKTNAMLHNEVPAANKTATNIVAMDTTYAPDEFLMNGVTIVGFDADLARALAVVLGINIKLQTATFSTIIPGLTDGKYQIGDSSFTDTLARQKQVDFVDYFVAGEGFYVPTSSTFAAAKGLRPLRDIVAVEAGTTEQSDAQAQAKKCSLTVISFPDQTSANVAVSPGRPQVGFVDSQVAAYIVPPSRRVVQATSAPPSRWHPTASPFRRTAWTRRFGRHPALMNEASTRRFSALGRAERGDPAFKIRRSFIHSHRRDSSEQPGTGPAAALARAEAPRSRDRLQRGSPNNPARRIDHRRFRRRAEGRSRPPPRPLDRYGRRRGAGRRHADPHPLLLLHVFATARREPRFEWGVVGQYFFTSEILKGLRITLEITALAMVVGHHPRHRLRHHAAFPEPVVSGCVMAVHLVLPRNTGLRADPLLVQHRLPLPEDLLRDPLRAVVRRSASYVSTRSLSGVLALGLNEGAYMAEIVRAGIISVDEGQTEAAQSLGMTRLKTMRRIVLPQAMRLIVPVTGNETISMLKTSSLVSVIAVPELLFEAQNIYDRNYQIDPAAHGREPLVPRHDDRAHDRPVLHRAALRQGSRLAAGCFGPASNGSAAASAIRRAEAEPRLDGGIDALRSMLRRSQ